MTIETTRRGFLKFLGIGAAAAVIEEPIRKLWFVGSNAPVGSRIESAANVTSGEMAALFHEIARKYDAARLESALDFRKMMAEHYGRDHPVHMQAAQREAFKAYKGHRRGYVDVVELDIPHGIWTAQILGING